MSTGSKRRDYKLRNIEFQLLFPPLKRVSTLLLPELWNLPRFYTLPDVSMAIPAAGKEYILLNHYLWLLEQRQVLRADPREEVSVRVWAVPFHNRLMKRRILHRLNRRGACIKNYGSGIDAGFVPFFIQAGKVYQLLPRRLVCKEGPNIFTAGTINMKRENTDFGRRHNTNFLRSGFSEFTHLRYPHVNYRKGRNRLPDSTAKSI